MWEDNAAEETPPTKNQTVSDRLGKSKISVTLLLSFRMLRVNDMHRNKLHCSHGKRAKMIRLIKISPIQTHRQGRKMLKQIHKDSAGSGAGQNRLKSLTYSITLVHYSEYVATLNMLVSTDYTYQINTEIY